MSNIGKRLELLSVTLLLNGLRWSDPKIRPYRHPAILEAAVVAQPDHKWGETPCAFVTLREKAIDVSEQDIIDYCRDNMAHFKAPKTVIFGALPKTSTGKIQKFVLRQQAAAVSA